MPYDSDEQSLFGSAASTTSPQASYTLLSHMFDRIRALIDNAGGGVASSSSSASAGGGGDMMFGSGTTGSSSLLSAMMPAQAMKSLKLDAQRPFSVILKYVILAGVNGFHQGTNGSHFMKLLVTFKYRLRF